MTVSSNTLTHVDSVALIQSGKRYVCPMAHSIYKEKDKKNWFWVIHGLLVKKQREEIKKNPDRDKYWL